MSRPGRFAVVGWLGLAVACIVPTDRSQKIRIDVVVSALQLLVGERTTLAPAAVNTAGVPVVTVSFVFTSTDLSVVEVDTSGSVLAVGAGVATIVVTARTAEKAEPDSVVVQVIDNVRLDAVAPRTARFGDTLTLIGAALDPASLTFVGVGGLEADVVSFASGFADAPSSRDTLRVIVPVGADSTRGVVVLHQRGASTTAPLAVLQYDLFEPNDTMAAWIPDAVRFSSAQLALEAGSDRPIDWYRFGPIDQSLTIELRLDLVQQFGVASVSLNNAVAARGQTPLWSVRALTLAWNSQRGAIEGAHVACRGLLAHYGFGVYPDHDFSGEVVRFPLRDVSFDSVDLTVERLGNTEAALAYDLRIVPGYVSDFPPDAYEENDFCDVAPEIGIGRHDLTLDHSFDVDWFRLRLLGPQDLSMSASYHGGPGRVDVDLFLYRDTSEGLTTAPDELPLVALGAGLFDPVSVSPDVVLTQDLFDLNGGQPVSLPPGEYLLLVRNRVAYAAEGVVLTIDMAPGAAGGSE